MTLLGCHPVGYAANDLTTRQPHMCKTCKGTGKVDKVSEEKSKEQERAQYRDLSKSGDVDRSRRGREDAGCGTAEVQAGLRL